MLIHDTTEKFFVDTLGYDKKIWKGIRTRIFTKLGMSPITSLTKTNQYKILSSIASSTSIKKLFAIELLAKYFPNFVEDKEEDDLSELVLRFATQYNVDPFELATQYKIIKRDMLEKGINPNWKLKIYKFPHTIKLTKIVLEMFIHEGIELVGNVPQEKEPIIVSPIKIKRKYTKKVKPLEA